MALRIAAVTMVYNEAHLLPIWLAHYARQLGAAQCHVIDHGSDDGSTEALEGVHVHRLPRSPQDDEARARFVSNFCADLLTHHDAVLYTDVDEIVVADPRQHRGLAASIGAGAPDVVTAVGLEVVHVRDREAAIVPGRPVSEQRRWVRFSAALCKPVLTRRKLAWVPGFHHADAPTAYNGLYLFHLRYYDLTQGIDRLHKTRAMPWARPDSGMHQRMSDDGWRELLDILAREPRREDIDFDIALPPIRPWLDRVAASEIGREGQLYRFDLSLMGDELWAIPPRFVGRF